MSQFNVYDIFGYLLPGALVVAVFFFALSGVVSPLPDLLSIEGSLALVVLAYLAGHFLRASIGEWIKSTRPSEWLLSDEEDQKEAKFTQAIKEEIRLAISATFSPGSPMVAGAQQQYFDLAYALIVAKNCAGNVPIYNSLYALYRGLIAACWLSLVILPSFVVLAIVFAWALHQPLSGSWLGLSIVLFFLLLYLAGFPKKMTERRKLETPLGEQLDVYTNRFAKGVYECFLAWYCTQNN